MDPVAMNRRTAPLLTALAFLAACTNSTIPLDWHRSRIISEGRRPVGLPGQPVEPAHRATPAAHAGIDRDPRTLNIFDGGSASPLGWSDLVARAADSNIILVGETHNEPTAQRVLDALWQDLLQQAPTAWLALEFFERDLEQKEPSHFKAMITDIKNHGIFIELVETLAFGLIHISSLTDDIYHIHDDGKSLVGRRNGKQYKVGDIVTVTVDKINRYKRQLDFRLV